MKLVVLGLSITSSWGNGHATTYRSLLREFSARGHEILFLERDQPWYAANRDLASPSCCRLELYHEVADLPRRFQREVREADCVIVGSYVPDGIAAGEWVTWNAGGLVAFYDIDTPVTLARLERHDCEYLSGELIRRYDLYLSFTGGPTLQRLEYEFGSPRAEALYCSVDPLLYYPSDEETRWDLGYLGTYSADRQPRVERLMIEPARMMPERSFYVAGAQYPGVIDWPSNVQRAEHLEPSRHRAFYRGQRFTLNITRDAMIQAGYSPSVRLFEAAACGTPIISDAWEGIETFFEPGAEILLADTAEEVRSYLSELSESERLAIGQRARKRVLGAHTAAHRAAELERLIASASESRTTAVKESMP